MNAVAARSACHLGGLSDAELVRLARGGHEPAFDAIVLRYRAPLVSYSRRWVDPHRAEEVVQHTFMKAYLCLRDDDRPLALRPWLYRVVHNAALNAVEKKGSDWEELDENYDGVPQPPQVAERRAHFLEVVDGIGSLPRRQRDALLLNEFEGRCYADIARRLGTSESGVRGLLRRARRQLRETAAALLLPFPALRELVRSDAGRLNVDRAGELLGSAGAVGGAGVAGGLTKVAAGVLAAGTIAGGGTAIEQRRDHSPVAEAKAAERAAAPGSPTGVAARAQSLVSEGTREITVGVPLLGIPGVGVLAIGADDESSGDGEALAHADEPAPHGEDPGAVEPEPLVPDEPTLPVGEAPEAQAEEEPGDEGTEDGEQTGSTTPPKESASTQPAEGRDDAEPAPDGETSEGPSAVPATPLQPQRQ